MATISYSASSQIKYESSPVDQLLQNGRKPRQFLLFPPPSELFYSLWGQYLGLYPGPIRGPVLTQPMLGKFVSIECCL